jgi:hypothetical protein
VKRLKWNNTRAFLLPGTVKPNMTDAELEIIRARILVARDIVKNMKMAVFPIDAESQIVELELLYEKQDTRTSLQSQWQLVS